MARVGVGPGQVKPVPGEELRVGETLTAMREDLAEFMGCIVKVADDLEEGAPHETVGSLHGGLSPQGPPLPRHTQATTTGLPAVAHCVKFPLFILVCT